MGVWNCVQGGVLGMLSFSYAILIYFILNSIVCALARGGILNV